MAFVVQASYNSIESELKLALRAILDLHVAREYLIPRNMGSSIPPEHSSSEQFPTTRWTLIFQLKDREAGGHEASLEELCQRYWLPIFAFARQKCGSADQAEDLTQGFFEKLIARGVLERAEESRGTLRAFMLSCLNHYITSEWRKERSEKRGGFAQHIEIDSVEAKSLIVDDNLTPTQAFDQVWALTLIKSVQEQLQLEFKARGKERQFEVMRNYLAWNVRQRPYAEGASELGMTESALRQAVLRVRQRFGILLRKQLTYITESEEQVEEEIRSLFAAFQ